MKGNQRSGLLVACVILGVFGGLAGGLLFERLGLERKDSLNPFTAGLFAQASLIHDFQSKRASSWNQTGKNQDRLVLPAGETKVILEEEGAGCIKHIYWTYILKDKDRRDNLMRGFVFRAFWDGSEIPSIEVPIGDFFGVSNGLIRPLNSLAFTTNVGSEGDQTTWGFNCYLPMPFSEGARIELENQSDLKLPIWYHIDYELYDDDSVIPDNLGRLHALWNRENPTVGVPFEKSEDQLNMRNRAQLVNLTGDENYVILEAIGNGLFVGYFLTVFNYQEDPWTWWGEGDDMIFIDGEGFPPSFHGTGSEEIFGGGACPAVEFTGLYTGFHCVENWNGKNWLGTNGTYRFHVQDPVRFREAIRVTIEHGHGNNKSNDYCSVAFWYHAGINQAFPSLPPFEERQFALMPEKTTEE